MITHVAMKFKNQIYALPKPFHHTDVYRTILRLNEINGLEANLNDFVLGFLSDNGTGLEFLDRETAFEVAFTCGQVKNDYGQDVLNSNDIW